MYIVYNAANVVVGYTDDKEVLKAIGKNKTYVVEEVTEFTIEDAKVDKSSRAFAKDILGAMLDYDPNVGNYLCVLDYNISKTEICLCFILGDNWKYETLEWLESVCETVGFSKHYISACGSTTNRNFL